MEGWKRWRHGKLALIPLQHDPGVQRGYMQGAKGHGKVGKSEHASRSNGSVNYWRIIPWGLERR